MQGRKSKRREKGEKENMRKGEKKGRGREKR